MRGWRGEVIVGRILCAPWWEEETARVEVMVIPGKMVLYYIHGNCERGVE